MGVDVYSLRKKRVEADLDAIYPVDVYALGYAYRLSNPWPGERGYAPYQRAVGRHDQIGDAAQTAAYAHALDKHGTEAVDYYVVMGGIEDGNAVYRTNSTIPALVADDRNPGDFVGYLYKVGRGKWIVSKQCPEHEWDETEAFFGNEREMTPAWRCSRCHEVRRREVRNAA